MIHVRPEGSPVHTGLNLYPLSEWAYSRGFILKLGKRVYQCRYAPRIQTWHLGWRNW